MLLTMLIALYISMAVWNLSICILKTFFFLIPFKSLCIEAYCVIFCGLSQYFIRFDVFIKRIAFIYIVVSFIENLNVIFFCGAPRKNWYSKTISILFLFNPIFLNKISLNEHSLNIKMEVRFEKSRIFVKLFLFLINILSRFKIDPSGKDRFSSSLSPNHNDTATQITDTAKIFFQVNLITLLFI